MSYIKIGKSSRKLVKSICDKVRETNLPGSQWSEMAAGVIDYICKNGQVSVRQANWLCINADYHDLPRPPELSDFRTKRSAEYDSDSTGVDQLAAELFLCVEKIVRRVLARH